MRLVENLQHLEGDSNHIINGYSWVIYVYVRYPVINIINYIETCDKEHYKIDSCIIKNGVISVGLCVSRVYLSSVSTYVWWRSNTVQFGHSQVIRLVRSIIVVLKMREKYREVFN